jgi:hypothetical protein
MKTITITLPEEVATSAAIAAAEAGLDLAGWLARLVQLELGLRPEGTSMRDLVYRGGGRSIDRV